jgi:hypothetical protein
MYFWLLTYTLAGTFGNFPFANPRRTFFLWRLLLPVALPTALVLHAAALEMLFRASVW